MKTAPHFVVGLTALAALSAGLVLAVEDRALFDPKQAMLVQADDGQGDAGGGMAPTLQQHPRESFTASRPASPVSPPLRP